MITDEFGSRIERIADQSASDDPRLIRNQSSEIKNRQASYFLVSALPLLNLRQENFFSGLIREAGRRRFVAEWSAAEAEVAVFT
jgi:hypothetical protein